MKKLKEMFLFQVILSTAEALTDYKPAVISSEAIADKISALGFTANIKSAESSSSSLPAAASNLSDPTRTQRHVKFDVQGM